MEQKQQHNDRATEHYTEIANKLSEDENVLSFLFITKDGDSVSMFGNNMNEKSAPLFFANEISRYSDVLDFESSEDHAEEAKMEISKSGFFGFQEEIE